MKKPKLTYAQAGIDMKDTDAVKQHMARSMETNNSRVLNIPGAFASLYDFAFAEYKHPVLVMKTEEPGSKQQLAVQYNRIESICYDMIHHLINDIIVMGAKPLAVQDAIICGHVDQRVLAQLVDTMAKACREQDCVLTGGETSIQPGVIANDTYILTSSIVGIVDKANVIDGSAIQEGDIVLGIASNGLHTNGYTLVRAIMTAFPELMDARVGGENFLDAIMRPHLCYYKAFTDLFAVKGLHGMAHITGGGIEGNLRRILPQHLDANIDLSQIRVLPIFETIRTKGQIDDEEMLRTFNMGVGMMMVLDSAVVSEIQEHLLAYNHVSYVVGEVASGQGEVRVRGQLAWGLLM